MRLQLQELQKDLEAQRIWAEKLGKDSWEDLEGVLHHQGLPYVPEIIRMGLISRHHHDPLAGHFGIEKTSELIARKYYWPTLRHDVEEYVKGCDVCLASKAVRHKPYGDLHSLPVPTHRWKDLSMDFVTGLPVTTDWKADSFDSILVIVDRLTKMVHYEPVQISINAPSLAEVIIDVLVRHHGLPDSIVIDRGSVFTSKSWLLLCYPPASNAGSPSPSIRRPTARPRGRIAQWRRFYEPLSIKHKIIGQGSFPWLSSPITTPRMRASSHTFRAELWLPPTRLHQLASKRLGWSNRHLSGKERAIMTC